MRRALITTLLLAANTSAAHAQSGLTLEEAVRLALDRDERTQASDQRARAAGARVQRARAFFFPDLTLNGNYTRRAQETTRDVGGSTVTLQSANAFSASATLSLSLFDARATPLYRQAKLEREAAELAARDSRRIVAFESADAFLQTLASEQVREATGNRVTFAESRLAEAQARVDAKLVSSNDATRAELELVSARREHTRAENAVRLARLALGHLLGRDGDLGPLSPPALLLDAGIARADDPSALQRRRFDIQAAFRRADALREFAKEPPRRFIPSLGLSGQFRVTNEEGFAGRNHDWTVGLNLTWVVWDGGERAAEEKERIASALVAELEASASLRRAGLDYRYAVANVDAAQLGVKQAQDAVAIARRNADEAAELYRQGLATSLVVADAGLRLFDAEVSLARERFALGLSHLDVQSALGQSPGGLGEAR